MKEDAIFVRTAWQGSVGPGAGTVPPRGAVFAVAGLYVGAGAATRGYYRDYFPALAVVSPDGRG